MTSGQVPTPGLDAGQAEPQDAAPAETAAPVDAAPADAAPEDAAPADAAPADGAVADASVDAADAAVPSPDDASTDAGDTSTPATGDPAAPGAATRHSVMLGETTREFLLYIPDHLDPDVPVPLVSAHHGYMMSGSIMEQITSWKAIAEREGLVVAFPDGGDGAGPWYVGEDVCNVGALVSAEAPQDDIAFVSAIIDAVDQEQSVDREKVFVAGFSMGGYFANHIGCQGKDIVRAVSAHSGATYAGDCPGDPIPVLIIHGDSDSLIPVECGREAYGYWLQRNGCSDEVDSEPVENGSCQWNQGCTPGGEVGMCTMQGMNHGWAGAPGEGAWLNVVFDGENLENFGGGAKYEDAAELIWRFFEKYL